MTDHTKAAAAAQILALPYPEGMTGSQQWAFERGLEAAAALVEAMPAPSPADAMREAMGLPEVLALVTLAERYKEISCEGFCGDLPAADTSYPNMHIDCGGCELRFAIAALKGASHE